MAKIDMGILGGFSGRLGTVVGYHRRGAWFVRAYQPHIKDRKSAAQLRQRSRFKAMIQFAAQATPVLRAGFFGEARAEGLTEGNVFLRENHTCFPKALKNPKDLKDLKAPKEPTPPFNPSAIDYPSLRFSLGSLPPVSSPQYTLDKNVVKISWSSDAGRLADRVHIYIYSPSLRIGIALQSDRAARHAQALLPEGFANEGIHLWTFAENLHGVSNTQYINQKQNTDEETALHRPGTPRRRPRHSGHRGSRSADHALHAPGLMALCPQLPSPPAVAAPFVDG